MTQERKRTIVDAPVEEFAVSNAAAGTTVGLAAAERNAGANFLVESFEVVVGALDAAG